MNEAKTFVFFPEGAYGPTNNCLGIGDVLRRRGHRVVFILEESFKGSVEPKGIEERLMRLTPRSEGEEIEGQFWKDFIRETAPVFRTSTFEQLEGFIAPTFEALIDGAKHVDERLVEIIDEVRPDVIVEDNVVSFPALSASGRPWVRIVSCNPAEIGDPEVPPTFSGYPIADRSHWGDFRDEFRRTHAAMHADFDDYCRGRGAPPLPAMDFIHTSPWLNLWLYPREVDYERGSPLAGSWENLEASVRSTDDDWALPAELAAGDGPLLYLSLGSLASGDVELMQQVISGLADSPYRVIVSKGPQHDKLELPANIAGEEFLPQTSVLPKVDLVITHGGNNTVTESLYFGKPMVVLPVFWDQHDNAQRIDETGFGRRLDTYEHEPEALRAAIDELVADEALAKRLGSVSRRLNREPGTKRAADLLGRVARETDRERQAR